MLVKVDGKDTESVVAALAKQVCKLPIELRKSLTWDRGTRLSRRSARPRVQIVRQARNRERYRQTSWLDVMGC
jgi:IS30 family transposase